MRPFGVARPLRSSSAFSSTTVLATERQRPSTRPAPRPQPQASQADAHQGRQDDLADRAGMAMRRTASRSATEKCRPTPNISRMTPISASWPASARVGDEARRERAHRHARDQVTHQRRQAQPEGQEAEDEGQHEADRRRRDQSCLAVHRFTPRTPPLPVDSVVSMRPPHENLVWRGPRMGSGRRSIRAAHRPISKAEFPSLSFGPILSGLCQA